MLASIIERVFTPTQDGKVRIPRLHEYLGALVKDKLESNKRLSQTALARQFQINQSHLSRILKGEKSPSLKTLQRMASALKLGPVKKKLLFLIYSLEQSRVESERKQLIGQIAAYLKYDPKELIAPESLAKMPKWYHMAIAALRSSKGFQAKPLWISRRLGISQTEANQALLELSSVNEGSGLRQAGATETTDDIPSDDIRALHEEFLLKARQELKTPNVLEREFQLILATIPPSKMGRAKEMIRTFVEEFAVECESPESEDLYSLNVAFFKVTK